MKDNVETRARVTQFPKTNIWLANIKMQQAKSAFYIW